MTTRIGVVTFPGSLDDGDAARAARIAGAEVVRLWHAESDLRQFVTSRIEGRQLGFLGEPRVNVLLLNLAMDERWPPYSSEKR